METSSGVLATMPFKLSRDSMQNQLNFAACTRAKCDMQTRRSMQLHHERKILDEGKKQILDLPEHVDFVSSLKNPFVKSFVRLRQSSSFRETTGLVPVVGLTPLREICEEASFQLEVLVLLENTTGAVELVRCARRIIYVSTYVMEKLAGVSSAEAITHVGLLQIPSFFCKLDASLTDTCKLSDWCPNAQRILVLDGIQDPGNLGTLLRTATAFAWDGAFLLPGCCDPFNDKAFRASRGANFRLPIASGTWNQLKVFSEWKKLKLYAAALEEKEDNIYKSKDRTVHRHQKENFTMRDDDFRNIAAEEALCLVLGSEGQGLSDESKQSCHPVTIPMPGQFESLNVSVAGGILMYLLNREMRVDS